MLHEDECDPDMGGIGENESAIERDYWFAYHRRRLSEGISDGLIFTSSTTNVSSSKEAP